MRENIVNETCKIQGTPKFKFHGKYHLFQGKTLEKVI